MDIIKKVTKDAERLLRSLRANYYIELPTGEEISHGLDGYELVPVQEEVEAKPERKKRTNRTGKPFGSLVAYYKPLLDAAQKRGDIAVIPFGDWNPDHLRGAICAHCTQAWGKASYTSVMNKAKKQIEVLRLADPQPAEDKPEKMEAAPKVNGGGTSKFRSVGHGLDALGTLHFEAYDDDHDKPQK